MDSTVGPDRPVWPSDNPHVRVPLVLPRDGEVDVLAVGENSLDIVAVDSRAPVLAAKHILKSLDRYVGGQAATAAVTCARQGLRAGYVGAFGNDEFGAVVRARLVAEGVTVIGLERPGASSRAAVIVVDPAGDRTVYEYRDPRLGLDDLGPVTAAVTRARVVMLDATDMRVAIAVATAARAAGIPTVIDIDRVTAETPSLLRLIDFIVAPEAFVLAASGADSVGAGLAALAAEFAPSLAVATLGSEGSLALAGGREIRTPGFQVPVADTTGAGDAFRGGLVSAWVGRGNDADLAEVLAAANATAALNCRAVGAQTSLPTRAEVDILVTKAGGSRSK